MLSLAFILTVCTYVTFARQYLIVCDVLIIRKYPIFIIFLRRKIKIFGVGWRAGGPGGLGGWSEEEKVWNAF